MGLYADDTKLASVIHNQVDCVNLQSSLNELVNWSCKWGMRFNVSKCQGLPVHNKNSIVYDYNMNGTGLKRVNEFNDLGILITSNLTWEKQITVMCSNANRRLGYVKRTIFLVNWK